MRKIVVLVIGLFFLLTAYFSGFRLYERLVLSRLAARHLQASLLLDIGGNALLLVIGVLGVGTMFLAARSRLVPIIRNLPYVIPGILVAVFAAAMGAVYALRISWILPASTTGALMALFVGWNVLRQHGLPINARVSDMIAARERQPRDRTASGP